MYTVKTRHVSMPPLPSGWFYDGQTFTDGEGDQHEFRPDFESIMIQHLKTLNQRISDKEAAEVMTELFFGGGPLHICIFIVVVVQRLATEMPWLSSLGLESMMSKGTSRHRMRMIPMLFRHC